MSKRCSPRSRSARVIANGKSAEICPLTRPVYRRSSSLRWPRAAVPSTSGRAELPSAYKSLARYGRNRGLSCMSCRQAANVTAVRNNARPAASVLLLLIDVDHLAGAEAREKRAGAARVELRVARLDDEEKTVGAGMLG